MLFTSAKTVSNIFINLSPIRNFFCSTRSAHQDLLFCVRCLAPLAGLVANSTPAAAAWYDLLNAKTLLGTGLPCHPWVGGADSSSGGVVPSSCPVYNEGGAMGGTLGGAGKLDGRKGATNEQSSNPTASRGNGEEEAAFFVAMSSAADSDEWSAMLVGAGLVRSLVSSLHACVDLRVVARGADLTKEPSATPGSGSSARCSGSNGNTESVLGANRQLKGGDVAGGAQHTKYGGLGCELETTQVLVMTAVGALLSAHPLAARDRFQLAGGALRLHRIISRQPRTSREEGVHVCVSPRGVGCGNVAAPAFPFLQEHCALVALQVLRLCLRAGDGAKRVPPDILEGVVRLVGALSPPMLSTWSKSQAFAVGGREGRPFRPGLTDDGEGFQEGVAEGAGRSCYGRGVLTQEFLPLGQLEEVPVPETNVVFGFANESGTSTGVSSSSESLGPTTGLELSLNASYRLCG